MAKMMLVSKRRFLWFYDLAITKRDNGIVYVARTALYEKVIEYFPNEIKQPKGNLIDLVQF